MKLSIGPLRGGCWGSLAVLGLVLFGGTAVLKSADETLQVLNRTASPSPQPGMTQNADNGRVVMANGRLELVIVTNFFGAVLLAELGS